MFCDSHNNVSVLFQLLTDTKGGFGTPSGNLWFNNFSSDLLIHIRSCFKNKILVLYGLELDTVDLLQNPSVFFL